MFTTGSKLFLGATGLALASLLVFGATHGGEPGWLGTVVLVGALLFTASDLSVARDRFVKQGYVNRLWGWPTYFVAQLVLAWTVATASVAG